MYLLGFSIADDRKALNLALRDQIAALRWVQANIGIFGGDRKKVSVKQSVSSRTFDELNVAKGHCLWRKRWCYYDFCVILELSIGEFGPGGGAYPSIGP